jgi:glycosyltransferase 2 family protein
MNFKPVLRFLRERVNWHAVGICIGLALVGTACIVLYNILHDLEIAKVYGALRRTPPHALILAGLFVTAGYFTLTFYDYFALQTIGKKNIPYRIAALAGFTSYSIGHNIGFTALSGGAVRYRIYSLYGLTVVDVAKICVVAGLTFWLGNIAFLGFGMLVEPEAATAIDKLPNNINRAIGAALLVGLVVYVLWVGLKPRTVGVGDGKWNVTLPGYRPTIVQIAIGVVDLTCCAAAMYVLMPASQSIDFISLAVIFACSTLLGFASSSPGGLGVFDAAMLVALMHYDKHSLTRFAKESVLSSLLLFRLFYYIAPFAISLAIMGVREFILDLKPVAEKIVHSEVFMHHDEKPKRTKRAAKLARKKN